MRQSVSINSLAPQRSWRDELPPSRGLEVTTRQLPLCFAQWLGALPADQQPDGRFLVSLKHVRDGVLELFDQCDVPEGPSRRWWADDVISLCEQFSTRAGINQIDVRLERITGNACWKFHVDNVPLRLITSYCGPGTELVPEDHGEEALAQQREYRGPLHRLGNGDVAIFRGGRGGIVHRSPPIAGEGVARSVLCLNIPSRASPTLWTPDDAESGKTQ